MMPRPPSTRVNTRFHWRHTMDPSLLLRAFVPPSVRSQGHAVILSVSLNNEPSSGNPLGPSSPRARARLRVCSGRRVTAPAVGPGPGESGGGSGGGGRKRKQPSRRGQDPKGEEQQATKNQKLQLNLRVLVGKGPGSPWMKGLTPVL